MNDFSSARAPRRPRVLDGRAAAFVRDLAPRVSPKPLARPDEQSSVIPLPPKNPLRVTILVPQGTETAIAESIGEDLKWRGHELSKIKPLALKINTRNLRYFHSEDRGAAADLAEIYGAELRDFTSFRPSPNPGVAELWLADEPLPAWAERLIQSLQRQ